MTMRVGSLDRSGIGTVDKVFAPGTLPGECVSGTVEGSTLTDIRILEPSEHRVKPPCKVARSCGGCALQHAHDDFVTNWKVGQVASALTAAGLPFPHRNTHTSPPQSRRRAKFAGRRTKSGALVGFHARRTHVVVDADPCQVLTPAIVQSLPTLRELTKTLGSRRSEIEFHVTDTLNGLDLDIRGCTPPQGVAVQDLFDVCRDVFCRVSFDALPLVAFVDPLIEFGPVAVCPPPGVFLQATADGEAALQAAVADALDTPKSLVDLFSGIGTLSLPLAKTTAIHAVEGADAPLEGIKQALRFTQNIRPVTTELRNLASDPLTVSELGAYEAAIVDPPRAGAEAQMRQIAASRLTRVAMVSCKPETFARDAALLIQGGFIFDWIDVIDQFRWSPHVEVAAQFSRADV